MVDPPKQQVVKGALELELPRFRGQFSAGNASLS